MFEKLTLNDPVFNVRETHLNSPETHLNPPCEGGLEDSIDNEVRETHLNPPCEGGLVNSTDNEVQSIQAPSLTGRDGVGLGKAGEGPGAVARSVSLLIIHCSATLPGQRVSVQDIDRWHRQRGFDCIGYHFYITVDGTIWTGRPLSQVGAHCKGYNAHSIGICYEGGLDEEGRPCDTRTLLQKAALVALINKLREIYPNADVVGHNDLNLHKACPCFIAVEEYNDGPL